MAVKREQIASHGAALHQGWSSMAGKCPNLVGQPLAGVEGEGYGEQQ